MRIKDNPLRSPESSVYHGNCIFVLQHTLAKDDLLMELPSEVFKPCGQHSGLTEASVLLMLPRR